MSARTGMALTAAALLFIAADARAARHQWQAVPGHPNVSIDLASIRPEPRTVERSHGRHPIPSPDDTYVGLRLNGEPAFTYLACFPPPCITVSSDDGEYRNNNRLVGYIPTKAVMAMVCKRVAPPHDDWVCRE